MGKNVKLPKRQRLGSGDGSFLLVVVDSRGRLHSSCCDRA